MSNERHAASFAWGVAESNFEKTDTYQRIFEGNYDGDFEHIADQIEAEAEKLYQQALSLILAA